VISLALGIGATTAAFSVLHAVILNPYPYEAADRIAFILTQDTAGNADRLPLTGSQLQQLGTANAVEDVLGQQGWELTATGGDVPQDVRAVFLTSNASKFFGVPALLGRGLIPSDAPAGQDAQPVAVLTYSFWQQHLGGSADVIGKTLQLDRKNCTIVGVLPRRFAWGYGDVYLPLKLTNNPAQHLFVSIRLRPGITLQTADAEFQSLFEQFARETPARYPEKFTTRTERLIDPYRQRLGHTLYLLFGAVLALLFIGCANVSILLLARGVLRQRELAVRSALGASHLRILRQLLTESAVLSLGGALLGMLFAYGTVALIAKWLPVFLYPREAAIEVSLPVLCFSIGLALFTGILFGLWPALRLTRGEVGQAMQSSTHRIAGGVRGRSMHSALIASQIAMTLLLLTAAAAAMESFLRLTHSDLGYDPHNVLVVQFPIHDNTYMSWNTRAAYFERLRTSIETIPGVVSAGISSLSTPPASGWPETFEIMGKPNVVSQHALLHLVSPEYFSILRIPLVRGRMWDELETTRAARVAVINETMARQFWPSGDALGRAIRLPELISDPPLRFAAPDADQWIEIVGIVADARNVGLANSPEAAVYLPYTAWLGVFPGILVRTISSPLSMLHAVRLKVSSVDPNQQVAGEGASLEEFISHQPELGRERLVAMLLSGFSIVAYALAIVGLYSVVSYSVAQRTNEFGIRIALGAQPRNVLWNVFAAITLSVGSGLAAGILLSAGVSKLAARWIGTSPHISLITLGTTLLLVCTSTLASFLPARRAASIDPMEALRHE